MSNMNSANQIKVPRRILGSLLSSVSAGVVPPAGAPYNAIGRADEIAALLSDLEQIGEGGGSMRFLIGRYGSGKSFLIQLIRGYALERDFLTADADLSPERRLYGSGGSGAAAAAQEAPGQLPGAESAHLIENGCAGGKYCGIISILRSLVAAGPRPLLSPAAAPALSGLLRANIQLPGAPQCAGLEITAGTAASAAPRPALPRYF